MFNELWLAFNPEIAIEMGWQLDGQGLFRWSDSSGELMVESICWQDGNLAYQAPHGYGSLCCKGWLVVASTMAYDELIEKFGNPVRGMVVTRILKSGAPDEKVASVSSMVAP